MVQLPVEEIAIITISTVGCPCIMNMKGKSIASTKI